MDTKILTLDNLYEFFVQQNKDFNFSAKSNNHPIVVSVPGNFEASNDDMPGMLKVKLKVCHTELNRNGSFISKENMEKAMPTLKYRPILAYIHQLDDGTWDFYAHNIEIVTDENGDEQVNYLEKQVGCFTVDEPSLEYDEEMDKTYVIAYAVIPEDYTQAADIIRRKQGTKVSCELVIDELSYNAKEKYLELTDFYFGGTTLLGCDENGNEIGEGMLGARADIAEFCHEKPVFNYQDKLVEALEKLNVTLEAFSHTLHEEGGDKGMDKFNELLEKYGKTAEDVTFEFEGLSDEELEVKFKEAFEEEVVVEDPEEEPADDSVEEPSDSDDGGEFEVKRYTRNENYSTLIYEISHEDIRDGIYNLLWAESDSWPWIIEVFDGDFIYQDYEEAKFFKRGYTIEDENVMLSDEKVEVFSEWLTQAERDALKTLKSDYSELEAKYNDLKVTVDTYEAAQSKAKKDEIFAKEEYECLVDDEDFKKLVEDAANFSVEEIESKVKAIFADHVIASGKFSANKPAKSTGIKFSVKTIDEGNKKPYGTLFED